MNKNEIKLQKNNSNRDWSDLEWIQEFHSFLQGDIPEGISLGDEYKVKLTPEQSSTVIWYLQEHFPILPDSIEMCDVCKRLYDSYSEGSYYEIEGKNFCGACEDESEATYCDNCMSDMWKSEGRDEDTGLYLCKKCKEKRNN